MFWMCYASGITLFPDSWMREKKRAVKDDSEVFTQAAGCIVVPVSEVGR